MDLYPGVHPLTAVATDNLGLAATSAVVSVTVTSAPIANPIVDRIPKGDITVELRTIADGMVSPLGMAVPDDGSGRMFVYDQAGLLWLVTASGRSPTPVLDLRTRLVNISGSYDERGLLGLAVHTNFAQFPYLYTYTSEFSSGPADFPSNLQLGGTNNHQSVIAEWRLNPSTTNVVDPATRREVLRIDQPQSNHNGGTMRFGPDGLLYVSLGDGGQADDQGNGHTVPGGNGQDTNNILGSVIRIDVDGRNSANGQYGVPSTTRSSACPAWTKSTPTVCAIRSASTSIAAPVSSTWATWARTRSRKLTSSPRAATTAGTSRKAPSTLTPTARPRFRHRLPGAAGPAGPGGPDRPV